MTDLAKLDYLSRDLSFEPYEVAEVAVGPGSTDELSAVVRPATKSGMAIVPPRRRNVLHPWLHVRASQQLLIDMRRLDRIAEANAQDLYAVVECGALGGRQQGTRRARCPHAVLRAPLVGTRP
jgi:FAD/FMN-containing dehydrogenase